MNGVLHAIVATHRHTRLYGLALGVSTAALCLLQPPTARAQQTGHGQQNAQLQNAAPAQGQTAPTPSVEDKNAQPAQAGQLQQQNEIVRNENTSQLASGDSTPGLPDGRYHFSRKHAAFIKFSVRKTGTNRQG